MRLACAKNHYVKQEQEKGLHYSIFFDPTFYTFFCSFYLSVLLLHKHVISLTDNILLHRGSEKLIPIPDKANDINPFIGVINVSKYGYLILLSRYNRD